MVLRWSAVWIKRGCTCRSSFCLVSTCRRYPKLLWCAVLSVQQSPIFVGEEVLSERCWGSIRWRRWQSLVFWLQAVIYLFDFNKLMCASCGTELMEKPSSSEREAQEEGRNLLQVNNFYYKLKTKYLTADSLNNARSEHVTCKLYGFPEEQENRSSCYSLIHFVFSYYFFLLFHSHSHEFHISYLNKTSL